MRKLNKAPQRRRYDAPRRAAAAAQTRERIVRAAKATFEKSGWAGATIPAIARAARVSHQTVVATFGSKAEPGTIRGDFGVSNSFNLIHGSDSPEAATRELGLFFKADELLDWTPASQSWVYDMAKGQPE